MNHSCDPNSKQDVTDDIEDNNIAVIALKDIQKGEEITISYINLKNIEKKERRKQLKIDYNFECNCKRCEEEDTK